MGVAVKKKQRKKVPQNLNPWIVPIPYVRIIEEPGKVINSGNAYFLGYDQKTGRPIIKMPGRDRSEEILQEGYRIEFV